MIHFNNLTYVKYLPSYGGTIGKHVALIAGMAILDANFVALKLQLQNGTCKPGAIFSAICRRDVAGVSNMFET